MLMKKEDIITLKIDDLGSEGLGIGHTEDGMAIFVKDSVVGDLAKVKIIKVKKSYAYGRLMEILTPSPYRADPLCPVARSCGGCQIQMMDYAAQLAFKQKKVKDCLERIGGFENLEVPLPIGMEEPWHYRNKAQFPIGRNKEGALVAGFYAGRTHSIIDNRDCLLGTAENKDILDAVLRHMETYKILPYDENTGKGLVRHVMTRKGFVTGQIMVCLVINGGGIPHSRELIEALEKIPGMTSIVVNENREKTNVIMGRKTSVLWGSDAIEDKIGDVVYRISARSFYQVNPVQTEKLYGKALEYAGLTGHETVWDVYCGIGTISLFLAQKAGRVYGVEVVPEAIENAKQNAERNGIKNASFYVGKAEDVLPAAYEKDHVRGDVIVVDPPRAGCEKPVLDTMLAMAPERIVYVSCDPATLARDLKILCEGGYRLEKVQPVDMFPHSVHVETVVLLSKGHVDSQKVRVEFSLEDMDMSKFRQGATYKQIHEYVLERTGLNVSNLYIAQIKQKHGIIERENYNKAKPENARVPNCPPEKEAAITEALKHFHMI